MKCPHCSHVSEKALLKCGECGEAFDRDSLEELQHLNYLLDWIEAQSGEFEPSELARLIEPVKEKRAAILASLLPAPEPVAAPEPEPVKIQLGPEEQRQLALIAGVKELLVGWILANDLSVKEAGSLRADLTKQHEAILATDAAEKIALLPVSAKAVNLFALDQIRRWTADGLISLENQKRLIGSLAWVQPAAAIPAAHPAPGPVPLPTPQSTTSADLIAPGPAEIPAPEPAPPPPKEPPKPREPLIRWDAVWGKVVEAAVSGLLLRWLRYLGAFLFVVSIGIVVVNFWNEIPQWAQVLIIFFVPAAFYGGGLVLRKRLQVVQTGGVLMGVGQILLAVDFAAIYQFGGLEIPVETYWLITSLICTIAYALTILFVVRDEFFGYIGLAGLGSTVMAITALGSRLIDWPLVSFAAFSLISVEAGYRLEKGPEKWREIGEAARRFPQIVIPLVLLTLLLIPGVPGSTALAAAFWLASLAAGLLSWRFAGWVYSHAAVWLSGLAAIFSLWAGGISWVWFPAAGAVLSLAYMLIYRALSARLSSELPHRAIHLMAFSAAGAAAWGLSAAAGLAAVFFEFWPGVIALFASAMTLASFAVLLRRPVLVLFSGGALVVPVSLAAWEWLTPVARPFDWLMAVWGGLAFGYLALASVLRRRPEHGRWLALLTHSLIPASLLGILISAQSQSGVATVPALSSLAASIAVYALSAVLNHSQRYPAVSGWTENLFAGLRRSIFLYPLAALLPVFAAVAWSGSVLSWPWLGALLGGLMSVYIVGGTLLRRIHPSYRLPFTAASYLIGLTAIAVSMAQELALMTSVYLAAAGLSGLARVYRRPYETGAAGLLMLWAFGLSLNLVGVLPHAFTLAYLLLAAVVYVPLGLLLKKRAPIERHHLPLMFTGFTVSGIALVGAVGGNQVGFAIEIPWVAFLVPLLATGLYVFSVRSVHPGFSWAASAALPLAFWRGLDLIRLAPEWHAAAWAGLGISYLFLWRMLHRSGPDWLQALKLPVWAGSWLLVGLSLLLTLPVTASVLAYGVNVAPVTELGGPIAAQFLAAVFLILASVLSRAYWPLFLEPWLALLPVTLVFIGYGDQLTGAEMTSAQFGIVWAVLGVVHLVIALGLDQRKQVRETLHGQMYGLQLGGYLMPLAGVGWSLAERPSLLWSFGVLIASAAVSAVLVHYGRHPAWQRITKVLTAGADVAVGLLIKDVFLWLAAWMLPIWVVLFLDGLPIVQAFVWLGLGGAAVVYLGAARLLSAVRPIYWWPFTLAAQAAAGVGLLVTAPLALRLLAGRYDLAVDALPGLAVVLLQLLVIIFYSLFAWENRRRLAGYLFAFPTAVLSFFPMTLALILSGRLAENIYFAYPWLGLAGLWLVGGFMLDQHRARQEAAWHLFRPHGPYLFGYFLAGFAVVWALAWSIADRWPFVIGFGVWTAITAVSAWTVHQGRHHAWDDLISMLFGAGAGQLRRLARGFFVWAAAWSLPVWATLLLWQLGVVVSYGYLGYAAGAVLFLAVATRLRGVDHTYAWAFLSAAQVYTVLSLLMTVGTTWGVLVQGQAIRPEEKVVLLGTMLVQVFAVLLYTGSSAYFSSRRWAARVFAHLAAFGAWVPFSLVWVVFRFDGIDYPLAYAWTGFAAMLITAGLFLDRKEGLRMDWVRVGYAHGPHLAGYLGLGYAVLWSWQDRQTNLYVLGISLFILVFSHAAVHAGRHETWLDFSGIFKRAGQTTYRIIRAGFLWLAAYAFPVWLTSLLAFNEVPLAWRGLALALTAPVYVAAGLAVRRSDRAAAWPLFSAGYLLTAVGAMISIENQLLAIYVLALDAVVYAVSAYIFRQPVWLYLTTALTPVIGLLALEYRLDALPAAWIAGGFMGLAIVYLGIGWIFNRGWPPAEGVSPYALAFFAPGYLLSAVALAASSEGRELALIIFLVGITAYAVSARMFRESVFLYPAAWLAAVPYYLGMTYTRLDPAWYGIGWLPLIAAAMVIGRLGFHRAEKIRDLGHPALPFYILAYALSLSMVFISRGQMLALTAALGAAAALYLFSARLFRRAWWLYPGLLALHGAVLTAFNIEAIRLPAVYLPVALLPVTLAMGIVAGRLWKGSAVPEMSWKGRLGLDWAVPFAVFAVVDVLAGQVVSLYTWEAGIITAVGHAALLGAIAWMWASRPLVWGSVSFLMLGLGLRLAWAGLAWPRLGALAAGVGFGLYLTAWASAELAHRMKDSRKLTIWEQPLAAVGQAVTGLGLGLALIFFAFGAEIAVALAFAGSLLLGMSYRRRRYGFGYLGVALLEAAFVIIMLGQEVRQPQWYAIPVGLYFVGLGYFERRRGRVSFASVLESVGLIVLLLTSFGQSLNEAQGFWYFLLLLVEAVLVIIWSAQQRRKVPFLIGAGGMLANVIGQIVIVLLYGGTLVRWLIFGGLGLLILLAAIYAERWIIPRAQDLRERLEDWA